MAGSGHFESGGKPPNIEFDRRVRSILDYAPSRVVDQAPFVNAGFYLSKIRDDRPELFTCPLPPPLAVSLAEQKQTDEFITTFTRRLHMDSAAQRIVAAAPSSERPAAELVARSMSELFTSSLRSLVRAPRQQAARRFRQERADVLRDELGTSYRLRFANKTLDVDVRQLDRLERRLHGQSYAMLVPDYLRLQTGDRHAVAGFLFEDIMHVCVLVAEHAPELYDAEQFTDWFRLNSMTSPLLVRSPALLSKALAEQPASSAQELVKRYMRGQLLIDSNQFSSSIYEAERLAYDNRRQEILSASQIPPEVLSRAIGSIIEIGEAERAYSPKDLGILAQQFLRLLGLDIMQQELDTAATNGDSVPRLDGLFTKAPATFLNRLLVDPRTRSKFHGNILKPSVVFEKTSDPKLEELLERDAARVAQNSLVRFMLTGQLKSSGKPVIPQGVQGVMYGIYDAVSPDESVKSVASNGRLSVIARVAERPLKQDVLTLLYENSVKTARAVEAYGKSHPISTPMGGQPR